MVWLSVMFDGYADEARRSPPGGIICDPGLIARPWLECSSNVPRTLPFVVCTLQSSRKACDSVTAGKHTDALY